MADPILSGSKWTNLNVTVSFMPDGAKMVTPTLLRLHGKSKRLPDVDMRTILTDGADSNLFALYDAKYPRWLWQGEFLRALQTWQDACALTFTLVEEQIDPATGNGYQENVIPALPQGDPRFGDIRYAASPSPTFLSLGHGWFPSLSSAVGGDVIINGHGVCFIGSNPDLYSLILHESGGGLGINENQPEPSVMNGSGPFPNGLYPIDIRAVQAMYGPPPVPDDRPRIYTAPPTTTTTTTAPLPPPPPPPIPGQPKLKVTISWEPVQYATHYRVERSGNSGIVWHPIANITETHFSDTTAVPGTMYLYRIFALNSLNKGHAKAVLIRV